MSWTRTRSSPEGGEGGDVGFGDGAGELGEVRGEVDGVEGAFVVGCAAGGVGDLAEVALAAEVGGTAADSCVAIVDGGDADAGALGVADGGCDVGAVLVEGADAAVVGVDSVGEHHDEAGFMQSGGRGAQRAEGFGVGIRFGRVAGPVLDELGEAEVGAGADASGSERYMDVAGGGGVVGGEGLSDADGAVFHVADEDFSSGGQGGDEGLHVFEVSVE